MKYFDKEALDHQTIERVEDTLKGIETIIWEQTLLKIYNEYREFYTKAGEELLDYYNDRVDIEAQHKANTKGAKEEEFELPF